MKESKQSNASKEIACSGKPCADYGSAFKNIKAKCSEGVPASIVERLRESARESARKSASKRCKQAGCSCVGSFYVKPPGKSPNGDQCVWWILGAWRGVCAADCGYVAEGPSDDPDGEIDAHGEMEDGPPPERPQGRCDGRHCAALASASIALDSSPEQGIDSALHQKLLEAAARVAEERATRFCPKGCECKGEFVVLDNGAEPIDLGKPKWIWWVGGEWRGKCLKLV